MAANNLKSDIPASINCGALILCTGTMRYLFLLRNNGRQANKWGIVGGKIEANETVLDGLRREIGEELGGSISDATFVPIETYHNTKNNFTYHTFLIKVDEEFIPELNHEHKGYCWVKLDDYPKPLHPGVWRTFNVRANKDKIKEQEQN
jgi:8-oxo-dGTP pyrophosphatase MutT (NUDIX family)